MGAVQSQPNQVICLMELRNVAQFDFRENSMWRKFNYASYTEHNEMTIKMFSKGLKRFSFDMIHLKQPLLYLRCYNLLKTRPQKSIWLPLGIKYAQMKAIEINTN